MNRKMTVVLENELERLSRTKESLNSEIQICRDSFMNSIEELECELISVEQNLTRIKSRIDELNKAI